MLNPAIGPRAGKVWGTTQLGFALNNVEVHAIDVKKGGYCSRHSHFSKWNRFVVLSGKLQISVFLGREDDEPDITVLGPGQVSDVQPGIIHEFEALEDTQAVEVYWSELDPLDINRHGTTGGMRSAE